MTESLNRKIARRYSKAVSNENFRSDGTLLATATVYDSTVDLPTSGVERGAQGYVSSNQRLYIRGTGGWYNIATINNTPTITSVQTAGGDESPFTLASDGSTTTVITITATDSEGFPITFSAVADAGFDSIATVSNDSSVFTITPLSEDSAGTATFGTLTFKASDGVNIASEVATFTLIFTVENSNFTTVLMKASGNNGTNTTINDASSDSPANNTAHTITVNGNVSNQAFTPYHPGGYSVNQINTDQLTFASNADFNFGSGDFTIEYWIWPDGTPNDQTSMPDMRPASTNGDYIQININSSNQVGLYAAASQRITQSADTALKSREWNHVALVRSGSTTTLYIDGRSVGTWSDSTTYLQGRCVINGHSYQSNRGWASGCYLRDFRIVKGTAVYTGNFSPPTGPLTTTGGTYPDDTNRTDPAASATVLLTCHLPYIADGSSSAHSVTITGTPENKRFGPYDHKKYSASEHGTSVYFDGNGDYLTIPTSADFDFGTGDYTIEFWHWPENIEIQSIIDQRSADSQNVPLIWLNGSGYYYFYINGSTVISSGNNSVKVGQWYHVVLQKSSNVTRLFINGVQKGVSYTDNLTYVQGSTFHIGRRYTGTTYYLDGHLCDFRIVKGTAVHNHSGFTPPTTPLTAIASTKLLTFNDTANIFNATGTSNDVVLGGTAKSSTAQKKNASASMLFDGNSDYVELANYDEYAPGTDDFVVEFWMRYTGGSGTRNIVDNRGQANGYAIRLDSSNYITVYSEPSSSTKHTSASALTQDQWYHIAFVRNGGNSYLFIDGTQSGSTATNADDYTSTSMVIGAQHAKNQQYFPGYVEDVRISTGTNRYPFIPAKTTLSSSTSGIKLLTAHAATITDGSSNSTVTANGDAAVSNFAPAAGMKSVYLDGTGDYLTVDLGANGGPDADFTIDFWYYATEADNTNSGYFHMSATSGGFNTSTSNAFAIGKVSNQTKFYTGDGDRYAAAPNGYLKWQHWVMTRASGSMYLYRDGSLLYTHSNSTDYSSYRYIAIGGYYSDGYLTTGYVSNFRYVKGTALYSPTFTPPTQELRG